MITLRQAYAVLRAAEEKAAAIGVSVNIAILDAGARSATVSTRDGLVCHVLSRDNFAALAEKAPATAIKLVSNLGSLLSHRLREANRTIQQLEE